MFELRPQPGPDQRHRLDAGKIIETAKNLADDINARLSGSSLAGLAEELTKLAALLRTAKAQPFPRRPAPTHRASTAG